jgi:glycosyltransferase involved in cell wall biosynthesis
MEGLRARRSGRATSIAIDAVGAKHSGAATVLLAVVRAALAWPGLERLVVFCSPRNMRRFGLPVHPQIEEIEVPLAEWGPAGRIAWNRLGLGRAARRRETDVLLCLSGGGVPPPGMPGVVFLQQSLVFSSEALSRLGFRARCRMAAIRAEMRVSLTASRLVIVQTPTMWRWVVDAFHVSPERVVVVEPEPGELPEAKCGSPALTAMHSVLPDRRLLYVGNASPYKNLEILPAALRGLRLAMPDATLFGTFPPGHPVTSCDGVVALPYLEGAVLREAYETATALVMPSLVETVGLPMLEAARYGLPVVAADRPYAHDVCGNAAEFFDPLDPKSLASRLEMVLRDERRRSEMAHLGRTLVAKRAAVRPYERMIQLVADLAR